MATSFPIRRFVAMVVYHSVKEGDALELEDN
jgi:hypothetical protein